MTPAITPVRSPAERYARSTALPLCVAWHRWRTGDTLDRLEEADPSSAEAGGPVLDASGQVVVRGIRVDCEDLIGEVLDVFDGSSTGGGSG